MKIYIDIHSAFHGILICHLFKYPTEINAYLTVPEGNLNISGKACFKYVQNESCVKHNSWLRHFKCHFRSDDVIMYIQNEVTAK